MQTCNFRYGKLPFLIREDLGDRARGQEVSLREREGRKEGRITGKSVGGGHAFNRFLLSSVSLEKSLVFSVGLGCLACLQSEAFAHILRVAHTTLRACSVVGPVDWRDCVCKGCMGRRLSWGRNAFTRTE